MAIFLAALITFLTLLVEHWFPWRMLIRRELTKLETYTLGTLAITLPQIGILLYWDAQQEALAMGVIVIAGGLAVLGAYGIDRWMEDHRSAEEAEEREQARS
jgi:hypothetical protein